MLYRGMICITLCAALLNTHPASAALGQHVSTIDHDQASMHTNLHAVTRLAAYTVHILTLPSGTIVREYVAQNGVVFGVAWEGPTLPNLKITLGPAFNQYTAASAKRGTGRAALSNSDLVIISVGHLRAFSGRAYVPRAVPAGVDIHVIQ